MRPQTNRDYLFVGVQFLLFFLLLFDFEELGFAAPTWVVAVGWMLLALGAGTCVLAVLQLRSALSPFPSPVKEGALVTDGLFSLARHPIYSGVILAAVGWSATSGSGYRFALTLILVIWLYNKSVYEERLLLRAYPEYDSYRRRVGRFTPWI